MKSLIVITYCLCLTWLSKTQCPSQTGCEMCFRESTAFKVDVDTSPSSNIKMTTHFFRTPCPGQSLCWPQWFTWKLGESCLTKKRRELEREVNFNTVWSRCECSIVWFQKWPENDFSTKLVSIVAGISLLSYRQTWTGRLLSRVRRVHDSRNMSDTFCGVWVEQQHAGHADNSAAENSAFVYSSQHANSLALNTSEIMWEQ